MKLWLALLLALQCALGSLAVHANEAQPLAEDPVVEKRMVAISEELRCLVCQNQTLAESDASLAADLRRQVESMIVEGRSDAQIKSFLVERYGDFVLYRPPVQSNTWALWFGPFALLVIGIAVWIGINRRRRLTSDGAPGAPAGATGDAAGTRARASADASGRASSVEGAGAATAADIERVRKLLDGQ